MDSTSKILIVDDSVINRSLLKEVLQIGHPNYAISLAANGEDALIMVEDIRPDIILMDVIMPGMDGFQVCSKLKSDPRFKGIPILLITGLDKTEQKINGFKVGAADYIIKPINEEETRARVEAHLRIKRYQDEQQEMNDKLKRAQSALIQNEKMSAVGALSAGISHEFNNILTMMGGYTQLAVSNDDLKELKEFIEIIDELVIRGKKIVKSLLNFSREDGVYKKEKQDICELFTQDLLLLTKMLNDNGVEVKKDFGKVRPIYCFGSQLSQVLINIVKNAIEAMKERPQKILTISVHEIDKHSDIECDHEHCVQIKVSDTGEGISDHLKEKIFEPFVTTKGVISGGDKNTPGTGLGLSITYGIVQKHQGIINIESKENEGTTFIVILPIINEEGE